MNEAERETVRGRQWQRIYCPHCGEQVSKSTYYRHRATYYDTVLETWMTRDGGNSAPGTDASASHDTSYSDTTHTDVEQLSSEATFNRG